MTAKASFLLVLFALVFPMFGCVDESNFPRQNSPTVFAMNQNAVVWHTSCGAPNPDDKSETKQQAVTRAWNGALELAAAASERMVVTMKALTTSNGEPPTSEAKLSVEKNDPAYVQFFKNDYSPNVLQNVVGTFAVLVNGINENMGEGRRPPEKQGGQITVHCQSVWTPYHADECQISPGSVLAITRNLPNNAGVVMNFCDPFFFQPRFDKRKAAAKMSCPENDADKAYWDATHWMDIKDPGTDASTLVHEWTHIPWVRKTNELVWTNEAWTFSPPETYGWLKCAQLAAEHQLGHGAASMNADNYAWYADYGYIVDVSGSDPWPTSGPERKPNSAI